MSLSFQRSQHPLNSNDVIGTLQRESNDLIDLSDEGSADLRETCLNAPETAPLELSATEFIPFISELCCLGATIDFFLDDTSGAKSRTVKATKVAGALNFMWKSKQISLDTKKLCLATPLNLAS